MHPGALLGALLLLLLLKALLTPAQEGSGPHGTACMCERTKGCWQLKHCLQGEQHCRRVQANLQHTRPVWGEGRTLRMCTGVHCTLTTAARIFKNLLMLTESPMHVQTHAHTRTSGHVNLYQPPTQTQTREREGVHWLFFASAHFANSRMYPHNEAIPRVQRRKNSV